MAIAGHVFERRPDGKEACACGKLKIDVLCAHKEDISQPGWAHVGSLSKAGYEEIDAERERIWERGKGS